MYTDYEIYKNGDEIVIIVDLGNKPTKLEEIAGSYKLYDAYETYMKALKEWGYVDDQHNSLMPLERRIDVFLDKGDYYFIARIHPKEPIIYHS